MKPSPRPINASVVHTLVHEGAGIAQNAPAAAAMAETATPKPSTGAGPNRSVNRPESGAPTPENMPRMMTK